MSMDENNKKMLTLKSSDDAEFEIEEEAALLSQTISHIVEDLGGNVIPLHNVTGPILAKVVEYLKKHAKSGEANEDEKSLKEFDKEFMDVEHDVLFELILAANYLCIKELLTLTSQTAADIIKDKSVEEVREFFNIENDFTPEVEEAIRKENEWAFDI